MKNRLVYRIHITQRALARVVIRNHLLSRTCYVSVLHHNIDFVENTNVLLSIVRDII